MIIKPGLRSPRYDSRDYIYHKRIPPEDRKDLSQITIEHDVPIIDQGKDVPCCVSIAVTTCMEVLDKTLEQPLSFMYNYYRARNKHNRLNRLEIRQALDAASEFGICTKSLHNVSLDKEGASKPPSKKADSNALKRSIAISPYSTWSYEHFENSDRVDLWRNAIQIGIPVIMGFSMTKSYDEIPHRNNTHIRPKDEKETGGHAVTVMGYDDNYNNHEHDESLSKPGAFLIRDSVGNIYPGNNGCWWLPYELVKSHLVTDSWAIISVFQKDEP